MTLARFDFTSRVRPLVELGIGDVRTGTPGVWDGALWVGPASPPLPVTTGLQAHWDADDASTFTYSSGNVVSQWRDKSGNNRHLAQATPANQPSRSGTQNGRPTVVFNGTTHQLATAAPAMTNTDNITMFVACRRTGGNPTESVVVHNGYPGPPGPPGTGYGIALRAVGGTIGALLASVGWISTATADPAAAGVYTLTRYLGTWMMWLNSVQTNLGNNASPNPVTGTTVIPDMVHPFAGQVYEVLFYNWVLPTAERNAVENYLKAKWVTPAELLEPRAFPDGVWSGVEPEWRDITCDTISARCEYGRRAVTDRFIVGAALVVVDNSTGWADPYAPDAPGILSVRPGRPIRVSVVHEVHGRRVLFRGFVDAMEPVYSPTESDTVALTCLDALGEVNRAKLKPVTVPVGAGETASARTVRILDAALWGPARDIWPSSETLLATDLGGQVADMLGVTAESAGGVVFGDYEGRVAFRPRDWQSYIPGTAVDGIIGNVGTGTPAVPPSITAHGYLTPTVGTVTTPDPGILPNQHTFVVKLRGPTGGEAYNVIAAQCDNYNQYSWRFERTPSGIVNLTTFATGQAGGNVGASTPTVPSAADQLLAFAVTLNNGSGQRVVQAWRHDGTAWVAGASTTVTTNGVWDSTDQVRIGAWNNGSSGVFAGRIYSVEFRAGLDPAIGALLWKFDADDYPGTGVGSYTDPRGRTWTLTNSTAITPKVVDPGTPATAPDVCPTRWERPFARADIATRAIFGRDLETAAVVDDPTGITKYGIEPFERTDLLTQNDASLTTLAQRAIRTRGEMTAPRVRSVSLDAATSVEALDLMSTVDVYRPSRYRCRLQYPPPRGLIFDGEYFATGVVHDLTPAAWTLELNLDVAAPFAVAGERWDGGYWNLALWSSGPALLAELRELVDRLENGVLT